MKFYQTPEFRKLDKQWKNKLKRSGFVDLEGTKEGLKKQNRRTIAWENREELSNFFSDVASYLYNYRELSRRDQRIVQLWLEGSHIKGKGGIAEKTGLSSVTVHKVIRIVKERVLKGL